MSARGWPWDVLEMEAPGADVRAVKRAYARRLKAIDPATDIAGFEALRRAYEAGLAKAEAAEAKAARQAARAAAAREALAEEGPSPGAPEGAAALAPGEFAAGQGKRPGDEPEVEAGPGPGKGRPTPGAVPVVVLGSVPGALAEALTLGLDRPERPADPLPGTGEVAAPPAPPAPPLAGRGRTRAPVDGEARARAARQRKALSLFQERAELGLIAQAIAGLTEDPDLAGAEARDRVRRALVGLLRDHLQPPFQGSLPDFGDAITRADLARIEARLGWMADHRAMRADLGGDPVLTEAVVDLLVGRHVIEAERVRRAGWGERTWAWMRGGGRIWTWAGLFLGYKLLQWKSGTMPDWAIWSMVSVSALVLAAAFLPGPVGRPLGRALRWALAPLARAWLRVPREVQLLLVMAVFVAGGMTLLIRWQLG